MMYRLLSHILVIGLLPACTPDDPPGQRQLGCARAASGTDRGEKMVFLLDLGRRTIVRLDGDHHGAAALSWDDYAYRFGNATGASATVGRYDGVMILKRPIRSSGQSAWRTEKWSCSLQKSGTIF